MKENSENIDESNGIVEVRYGDEVYKTWTIKLISPLITKFLKGMYPDSLAVRGLTDIVVYDNTSDDIIPVEIQKTPISRNIFSHSEFEKEIRKGLEDNIENYDKCWFFFDSEYLRFLQSENVGKNISIDMTWLVKLMKEEKLKTFVIRYDGLLKELTTKDFDFLKNISQTCILSYDSDERTLVRNKLKIKRNIFRRHNFTQEEISQFENEFDNRVNEKEKMFGIQSHCMKNKNERCKLYGNVLNAISSLSTINSILSCNINKSKLIHLGVTLGLFYQNEFNGNNKYAQIQFVDKFNIAQYFPGYLRNKEMWDYCKSKQKIFSMSEFKGIIEGNYDYKLVMKQCKTLADYD